MAFILRDNLAAALRIALLEQRKREAMFGNDFESALVAGWGAVLEALQRGERVEVREG